MGLAPEMVAAIAHQLAAHAGLELPAWVVEARAAMRIAKLEIPAAEYVDLIASRRGQSELDELIETVRVGESRLFRHRSQIAALVEHVVPVWRGAGKRRVQVWSAGCAAGEEPYTLAAILSRELPRATISILATDVSADALELAATASYPANAWNDIPDDWREAFVLDGDRVRVAPEVAALVRFERANLASPLTSKIRNCDLVWCRNVLIYFTPTARKHAIERLVHATNPGGFVFVGYSESMRDVAELEPQRAGEAVYYVRRREGDGSRAAIHTPATGVPVAIPGVSTARIAVPPMPAGPRSSGPIAPAPTARPPAGVQRLELRGQPSVRDVTSELAAKLAIAGLQRLIVDLDADLLDDDLAPVLRRARAAARAAHVELELHATRTGSRRWLSRHDLDEDDR